jgi:hypothetical protein
MKDQFGHDPSKVRGTHFWRLPHIGRRMFFRHMATALSGYFLLPGSRPGETVARAAAAPIGTAKNVIFIFLTGAPSHTDTFDLKEGAWTPAFMAPTSYGDLRFPQGLMPNIANQIGDVAFVRSLQAYATAHGLAQNWVQMGRNPIQGLNRLAPHIGSVVAQELGPQMTDRTLPAFMSLNASIGSGPGASFLPPEDEPFFVSPGGGGLANTTNSDGAAALDRRLGLTFSIDTEISASEPFGNAPADLNQFRNKARLLMYNGAVNNVFNFDQTTKNAYGNTGFGNACITARNLLRSGLGTRFIQISFGSWDHHGNIYGQNTNLQLMSRQFDAGLGALMADLKADGSFSSTLIVAMGEFGRTVGPLNANNGRDHHVQQSVLLAGAGIKGGRAIGQTNSLGDTIVDPGWSGNRAVRNEDIEATIYSALGIDWTKVIHASFLGRGFEYVPSSDVYTFQPINELWG